MSRIIYRSDGHYITAFYGGDVQGPCLQLDLPDVSRTRDEVIELHAAIGQWIRETAPPPAPTLWRPGTDPLPAHDSEESYRLLVRLEEDGITLTGSVCYDGDVLTSYGKLRERGFTIAWWMVLPPTP